MQQQQQSGDASSARPLSPGPSGGVGGGSGVSSGGGPLDGHSSDGNAGRPSSPPPGPIMDISRSLEDGSLLTAPLRSVIAAACDALYNDLSAMTQDEIPIVVPSSASTGLLPDQPAPGGAADDAQGGDAGGAAGGAGAGASISTGKMTSLSFSRRRHELSVRIARHGRAVTNAVALLAVYKAPGSAPEELRTALGRAGGTGAGENGTANDRKRSGSDANGGDASSGSGPKRIKLSLKKASASTSSSPTSSSTPPPPPAGPTSAMGQIVSLASDALRHVHEAWREADEAQDALYFHHGELWRGRRHCHDVCGAMSLVSPPAAVATQLDADLQDWNKDDIVKIQAEREAKEAEQANLWPNFPADVSLVVDRYENSRERSWTTEETLRRLQASVRAKLVFGEVGAGAARHGQLGGVQEVEPCPWRIQLEKNGGAVKLMYGTSRSNSGVVAVSPGSSAAGDDVFPIEARVTVLNEEKNAEWTLLSVDVHVRPKTGESSHQLEPNNRQKFNLHRLCARAMTTEEARVRSEAATAEAEDDTTSSVNASVGSNAKEVAGSNGNSNTKGESDDNSTNGKKKSVEATDTSTDKASDKNYRKASSMVVSRPLDKLFEVAHTFAVSLQLEMLSSQAVALKKGAWGTIDGGIDVSPILFLESSKSTDQEATPDGASTSGLLHERETLAVMGIHFWACDDRFGTPIISDLTSPQDDGDVATKDSTSLKEGTNFQRRSGPLPKDDSKGEQRLSLCIRAVPRTGLVVSLSGGSRVMGSIMAHSSNNSEDDHVSDISDGSAFLKRNVRKLLASVSNPFQLSASDAILAAAAVCAQSRCVAVAEALMKPRVLGRGKTTESPTAILPSWVHLHVEHGVIAVAGIVSYDAGGSNSAVDTADTSSAASDQQHTVPVELFRVACDSRTGRFIPVFPGSATLLRALACNDPSGSELYRLRLLQLAAAAASVTPASRSEGSSFKRRAVGGAGAAAAIGRDLTGRVVKDAFDSLARSMDVLGRRAGVGGEWLDNDERSASLRERAVADACLDVRNSLMVCCGVSAVYGLAGLALGVASGVETTADMAGSVIRDVKNFMEAPPLAIVLNQEIVERTKTDTSVGAAGETKKWSVLRRELLAVTGSVSTERLQIHCFFVSTEVEKPTDVPKRVECVSVPIETVEDDSFGMNTSSTNKQPSRTSINNGKSRHRTKQRRLLDEVNRIAPRFSKTLSQL